MLNASKFNSMTLHLHYNLGVTIAIKLTFKLYTFTLYSRISRLVTLFISTSNR